MRLNAKSVAGLSLTPGKRGRDGKPIQEERVFDDDLIGFGVRIRAGGKRSFIIQYRLNGQTRTYTIGDVGKIDTDKARAEAKTKLAQAQLGIDPQGIKANARAGSNTTLAKIAESYLHFAEKNLADSTAAAIKLNLTEHWAPLRSTPVNDITRAAVAAQFKVIEKERGPVSANRALAYLSGFFSWAMGDGIAENNPVIGANRNEEKKKGRALTNAELFDIWHAAGDDDYGRILRLLMLTGQRRDEVAKLARSEIDTSNRTWTIPAERTKNRLAHEVPLSDAAAEIMKAGIKAAGDRDMLFGRLGTGFSGWSKAKIAIDKRIVEARRTRKAEGRTKPWTPHFLRHTMDTQMHELGVQPHVVEACINHISGHKRGVAGTYNHAQYRPQKRQAFDLWASHVLALVGGKRTNVVTMKRGG